MLKVKKLILGLILSVLFTAVFLMILSLIILKLGILSVQLTGTLTLAAGGIALFFAAVLTAKMAGEKGLLHGLVLAAAYFLLYAISAVIFCPEVDPAMLSVRGTAYLLCGMLGGILGVGAKNKIQF